MRLLTRFLQDIGSEYRPEEVYKINNKRFTDSFEPKVQRERVVYNGFYLGQNKRWFEPSSLLLQKLSDEKCTRKALVGRDAAWLFVVGKDVFEENVESFSENMKLGSYCLVMFDGDCIGYGRYETSGDRKVIKNMFDLGDFLRRE
jgi:ribosome biogenesis protein Nip4